MILNIISTLLLLTFVSQTYAQNNLQVTKDSFQIKETNNLGESSVQYRKEVNRVFQVDEVIYYGIDISKVTLTDRDIIGKENVIKSYFPAWVAKFQKEILDGRKIINMLENGREGFKLSTYLDEVQLLYTKRSDQWIKFDKHEFDINDIKTIISSYTLQKDSGIGFVIIPSNFNKVIKMSSAYYIFFDIKLRAILWASNITSKPEGWGLTDYWSGALINSFKYFNRYVYRPEVKFYNKGSTMAE